MSFQAGLDIPNGRKRRQAIKLFFAGRQAKTSPAKTRPEGAKWSHQLCIFRSLSLVAFQERWGIRHARESTVLRLSTMD